MEEEKRLLILFCNKLFINIDVKVAEFQTKQTQQTTGWKRERYKEKGRE